MTDTQFLIFLTVSFLALPVCMGVSLAAGSFLTYRLMTGQKPIPSLPRRARVIRGEKEPHDDVEPRRLPDVRS